MWRSLAAITDQDGITIPASPRSTSRLIEHYLPDHGGYLLYALLNSAGAHPGAARGYLFHGRPGTGIADYGFKGLYHVRAYWIARSIRLHLDICHLAAPVLGWDQWYPFAGRIQDQLQPLADEAEKRFAEPLRQAMGDETGPASATSAPVQPSGTNGTP